MNAFEIEHVSKQYPGFALQDLSLTLPSGCILGLVGENGAGKSTTIRLLMNTIQRDAGRIRVLGTDVDSPEFAAVKEDVGVVLDEAYFPEVLSARQIGHVLRRLYRRWDSAVYERYLKRFGLPDKRPFKDYSRGMKMKLAIAAALSHSPRLLVLDEATSGLDPIVRDEILDIFIEFTRQEEHSILLSSHITSDLEKVCDYIAFLHQGRLYFCEEKDRLAEEYGIVSGSAAQLAALPDGAVLRTQAGPYGSRALVRRAAIGQPGELPIEPASIEDIMLFTVKGVERV